QRDGFPVLRAQRVFQNRIACRFEPQRIACRKFRHRAIELTRKSRARKDRIEMGDSSGGRFQGAAIGADLFGQVGKDATDLRYFLFGKLNEAIVQIDSFERLDKHSLPCSAGSMDDAWNSAAITGANRNDEAIVAQRDVILTGRLATSA